MSTAGRVHWAAKWLSRVAMFAWLIASAGVLFRWGYARSITAEYMLYAAVGIGVVFCFVFFRVRDVSSKYFMRFALLMVAGGWRCWRTSACATGR